MTDMTDDKAQAMAEAIARVRLEIEKLREMGDGLPCVERNCKRILAGVAMLELDVVDVVRLAGGHAS